MEQDFNNNSKPIQEVVDVIMGMAMLQINHVETAIPYLQGDPGIGKSSMLSQSTLVREWNFVGTHFGQTPIEEVSGLPTFFNFKVDDKEHKGTQWTLPDILSQLYEISSNNKPTIWLLDDFHLAPPAMMALGYEMFTERRLRGFEIPDNVAFILAGNTSAKAGSKKNLFSAIVNRCALMPVKVDFEAWKSNFAIPNKLNSKIISFLSNSKYRKFFQEEEQLDRPWSSARAWTKFSYLLNPMEKHMVEKTGISDIMYYCEAHCGTAAASEFATYYKIFSKVESDKIFEKLIPIEVPNNMTDRYIYMLANVNEFIDRYTTPKIKTEDRLDLCSTMGKILIKTANENKEIALTGFKEIIITEKSLNLRSMYDQLKNSMIMIDQTLTEKLTEDLFSVIK